MERKEKAIERREVGNHTVTPTYNHYTLASPPNLLAARPENWSRVEIMPLLVGLRWNGASCDMQQSEGSQAGRIDTIVAQRIGGDFRNKAFILDVQTTCMNETAFLF